MTSTPTPTSPRPRDPTTISSADLAELSSDAHVVAAMSEPRLALIAGVLRPETCDALMNEAAAAMARSEVIGPGNAGTSTLNARTSSGMHFARGHSAIADDVQRRLMGLIGMPVSHAEPLQVLRYGPGEVYVPHFDFFEPDEGDVPTSTVAQFGQRVATMICYLSAVPAGGATDFPDIGLHVRPFTGGAVYFTYVDDDGSLDRRTLHGGAPVLDGEKWILTQWCRARPYERSAD